MKLKELFVKREEIMQLSFSFPVGSLDWEKCEYQLNVIDACILSEMDDYDPEKVAMFKENMNIDGLIEEIFGIQSDKWSA